MACVTMITVLTYLDRLNFSIAGEHIKRELSFNTETMGWLLSAFLLGYALMQIPGGWCADRFGARKTLTAAVGLWSIFTVLTSFAPQLPLARWLDVAWSFAIIRFLVGVGEAASSPSLNKIVSNWMGSGRRGIGSSFSILGIGLGGAGTPVLIAWIMQRWGWQTSFVAAGALGLLIAFGWYRYVTDRPEEHPLVNEAELALIHPQPWSEPPGASAVRKAPPWRKLFSSPSVWGVLLGYMCQGYPIYFYHTWFFIYLVDVRHLTLVKGSFYASIPYLAIALLAPIGGAFSDFGVKKFGKRQGRRTAIWVGMLLSAALLWVGSSTQNNLVAILLLGAGAGFNMFAATTYWAVCIDLSEKFTGSLSGMMNTFGNLGGWLSPIVTAYLATHYGWRVALLCASLVTVASALSAALIKADQSLDDSLAPNLIGEPASPNA